MNTAQNAPVPRFGYGLCRRSAFTLMEVMVTLVILSIGMVGIYRAFLSSLNYQEHILARLHAVNAASDEFARAENDIIQSHECVPSSAAASSVYSGRTFFLERTAVPFSEDYKGICGLHIKLSWPQKETIRELTRASFVYIPE